MKATLTLFFFVLIGTGSAIFSQTVTIGTQVWMTKNLDVSTFRNGDPIPEAKTNEEWKKAGENKQPAWCYYDNDPANGAKYGKLYNWYAVIDSRGLAPVGYHIPTDAEWSTFINYLDPNADGGNNYNTAGGKMKSTGTQYWQSTNTDATNESGFSGLPGGNRSIDGTFNYIGLNGYWWSSSETATNTAWYRFLDYNNGNVYRYGNTKLNGFSVRCLRD